MKKFATLIFTLLILARPASAETLIPVGQVIGLELGCGHLSIADFEPDSPGKAAGLQTGDRLLKIDGTPITSASDVRKALDRSHGWVNITLLRGDRELTVKVSPAVTAGGPKLGAYLQQSITGVGTVTYYDPDTGTFAALGHGVNTKDGRLAEMVEGNAYPARVNDLRKGKAGDPGQLMGQLTEKVPLGSLEKNTQQGIFGKARRPFFGESLPTASKEQVKTGPATIRSTVRENNVEEYSVEIVKVYPDTTTGRNLLLKVTDQRLLDTTGGIVQGMSGSPIIQDGKLVGAVTHVLVNDPTTGYGIFIENMLDAAA